MDLIEKWRKLYGRLFDRYDYTSHVFAFHAYKAIYFAVPKTANTSLKNTLWNLFPENIKNLTWDYEEERIKYEGKKSRDLMFEENIRILKHQHIKYPDYLKFTFVRNPWDRLVSCYSDKILSTAVLGNGKKDEKHRAMEKKFVDSGQIDFDSFVRKIAIIPDQKSNRHYRSQYTFVCDKNGDLIPSFIGYYETLQEDFELLKEKLNVKDLTLPWIRKSNRSSYKHYYTEELRDIVAKRYEKDISLFGYTFE